MVPCKRFTPIIATALLFLSAPSFADITVAEYRMIRNTSYANTYIIGLGDGIIWTENYAAMYGQPRVFCKPLRFRLSPRYYKRILDELIDAGAVRADHSLGAVLLMGFKRTFPC